LVYSNGRIRTIKERKTKMIALIDGDSLPYKMGYVAEKENLPLIAALDLLDKVTKAIFKDSSAKKYILFLSGATNFRNEVATINQYKGNRKKEKPLYFKDIRIHLKENYNTFYVNGAEADDAVSVYQTIYKDKSIICSDDKDLLQVPGYHFNLRTKEIKTIDEIEAHYRVYHQLLTGDSTDNIKGIEGIGPAKAKKILAEVEPIDYKIECLKQYVNKYGNIGIEYCKETFRLVYMMREFKNITLPEPVAIK
jgi:5'-3' exonuclease